MVLITVRLAPGATLADALDKLGLSEDDADTAYGLVQIDPRAGLHALRVTEEATARMSHEAGGPFADPRIDPFN